MFLMKQSKDGRYLLAKAKYALTIIKNIKAYAEMALTILIVINLIVIEIDI
jgi:hypothetical protein